MENDNPCPYGDNQQQYRDKGFWVRPGLGKKCLEPGWNSPDSEISDEQFERWATERAYYNIGLVSGSPFPDGTKLGFLDIDNDRYTRLGRVLLDNPQCARFGSKGMVFPFRYTDGLKLKKKLRPEGFDKDVAEFLIDGAFCVIPPSIHPDTNTPYQWIGTSLLEIDFNNLPLIGE